MIRDYWPVAVIVLYVVVLMDGIVRRNGDLNSYRDDCILRGGGPIVTDTTAICVRQEFLLSVRVE